MGKSSAPEAPNYAAQAEATATGNLNAARAQTQANRMDQITPYGTIKYTQGGGQFNQAGYDAAKLKYAQQQDMIAKTPALAQYWGKTGELLTSPDRNSFMDSPDQWSSEIQLSDTGKQLLDSQNRTQLGLADLQGLGMDRVRDAFSQPFDTSGLTDINGETGMAGWDKYTQLLQQRMNPDLDAQQAALDTKLANQGLTAGSEGWGTQQSQFGKQRTDANVAAQLAGAQVQNQFFNQALAGNKATLDQRAYIRSLPLNELNALRTGSQVTNPTFNTPGQQGQTTGADLAGASNAQYKNQLDSVNASNAQSAQTAGAGIAAAGMVAAAFF